MNLQEAKKIEAEERSWKCRSCDRMIEPHERGPYCWQCRQYWEEVEAGLFEEEFYDFP